MGIFDFLKKNKNIENDNGLNIIYSNNGRGHLVQIFEKENGLKHGLLHDFTVLNNDSNGNPIETLFYSQAWRSGKSGGKIFTGDYLPRLPKPLDLHIFSFEEEKKKLMKLHSENYPSIKDKEGVPFSVAKAQKQKSLEKTHKKKSKGYVHGKSTQTYNPGPDAVSLSPIPKKTPNFHIPIRNEIEKEFYANGKLKNEATYKSGKQHGSEKGYHENGQLHYECEWIDGLQDGEITSYDVDGNKIKQSFLKKGSYEGIQREWWPNGKLRAVRIMKNHEVASEETYNQDGSIVVHEDKIEDLQTVEQLNHDNDTELIVNWDDTEDIGSVKQYKGQPFTGVCVKYDKSKERVKLSQNFKDGFRCGKVKVFYDNGQLEMEGNIGFDDTGTFEDGVTKLWYENGQLKKETNYDHDSPTYSEEWHENGSMKQQDEYEWIDGFWILKVVKKFDIDGQLISEDYHSTDGEIISKDEYKKQELKKEDEEEIKNKYCNLVIKRQEEVWRDNKNEEEYCGFSYILYRVDLDDEDYQEGNLGEYQPLEDIISIVHDDKNNIVYHCSLEDDDSGIRWSFESAEQEIIYGPDEIDVMFENDISEFGELLANICDLEKVLSKYLD